MQTPLLLSVKVPNTCGVAFLTYLNAELLALEPTNKFFEQQHGYLFAIVKKNLAIQG